MTPWDRLPRGKKAQRIIQLGLKQPLLCGRIDHSCRPIDLKLRHLQLTAVGSDVPGVPKETILQIQDNDPKVTGQQEAVAPFQCVVDGLPTKNARCPFDVRIIGHAPSGKTMSDFPVATESKAQSSVESDVHNVKIIEPADLGQAFGGLVDIIKNENALL